MHHYKKTKKKFEAITLIETLLYLSLVVIIIGAATSFFGMIVQARVRNQVITEVNQQGNQIMHMIAQSIRNANAVTAPLPGSSASTLNLDVYSVANNPTIFDLNSGVVTINEGGGSDIGLNSSQVTITNLTFENLSRTGTPGVIRIEFTIEYVSDLVREDINYAQTFSTSISLR